MIGGGKRKSAKTARLHIIKFTCKYYYFNQVCYIVKGILSDFLYPKYITIPEVEDHGSYHENSMHDGLDFITIRDYFA